MKRHYRFSDNPRMIKLLYAYIGTCSNNTYILFCNKLVLYRYIKIWPGRRRRRSVSTTRTQFLRVHGYASAMTNTEIVVTKTEHVDRVPGTHDKWLRSIRTEERINWKKKNNARRRSPVPIRIMLYAFRDTETKRMNRSRRCNVILLSRERVCVCVFFFYTLLYTVSKLIWTHRERSHARLMEFCSALETFFLGLYDALAPPVHITSTYLPIGIRRRRSTYECITCKNRFRGKISQNSDLIFLWEHIGIEIILIHGYKKINILFGNIFFIRFTVVQLHIIIIFDMLLILFYWSYSLYILCSTHAHLLCVYQRSRDHRKYVDYRANWYNI